MAREPDRSYPYQTSMVVPHLPRLDARRHVGYRAGRLVRRKSRIRSLSHPSRSPACHTGLKCRPLSLWTRKAKERVTEPFAQENDEWARNCMWET